MKLGWKRLVLTSFMLFSLFFGAGNLIFPPFLGQNAGAATPVAFLGFFITAVVLPVLGVIVVAKFNGLESLGRLVGKRFAIIFTLLIYLSIGPGLGIPRAASVPFEMAVAPYIPEGANIILFTIPDGTPNGTQVSLYMILYSLVFFAIVLWLCMTPGKLVKRIGSFLTPSLLILLLVLFITFLAKGNMNVSVPQGDYENTSSFLKGFSDGYQTMDAIAALNFGLVIAVTLNNFGIKKKKGVMNYTLIAGLIAGSILTFVYFMLAFIGANSSGVYPPDGNGAVLLRLVVKDLFGTPGAILLAAIFTLACLTTCVGLINSISSYFSTLFKKVSYKKWVIIITVLSFVICNLGLNTILSISVPILNVVYPLSIVLIFFGLTSKLWNRFKYVYPVTIIATATVSIPDALCKAFNLGVVEDFLYKLPLFEMGFFWIIVDAVVIAITMLVYLVYFMVLKKKGLPYPEPLKIEGELKDEVQEETALEVGANGDCAVATLDGGDVLCDATLSSDVVDDALDDGDAQVSDDTPLSTDEDDKGNDVQ